MIVVDTYADCLHKDGSLDEKCLLTSDTALLNSVREEFRKSMMFALDENNKF